MEGGCAAGRGVGSEVAPDSRGGKAFDSAPPCAAHRNAAWIPLPCPRLRRHRFPSTLSRPLRGTLVRSSERWTSFGRWTTRRRFVLRGQLRGQPIRTPTRRVVAGPPWRWRGRFSRTIWMIPGFGGMSGRVWRARCTPRDSSRRCTGSSSVSPSIPVGTDRTPLPSCIVPMRGNGSDDRRSRVCPGAGSVADSSGSSGPEGVAYRSNGVSGRQPTSRSRAVVSTKLSRGTTRQGTSGKCSWRRSSTHPPIHGRGWAGK